MLVNIKDLSWDLDFTDHISRQFYLSGQFEHADMIHAFGRIKPGGVVVDAGANIGIWSLLADKIMEHKGAVLAFEPSVEVYKNLYKNICLNGAQDRIVPSTNGLWNSVNILKFQNSLIPNDKSQGRICFTGDVVIETTTLDEVANKHLLYKIDLLKIDVEGAELKVLQGAEKLLKRKMIKNIVLEINPKALENFNTGRIEVFDYLQSNGFGVHYMYENIYIKHKTHNLSDVNNILFCLLEG